MLPAATQQSLRGAHPQTGDPARGEGVSPSKGGPRGGAAERSCTPEAPPAASPSPACSRGSGLYYLRTNSRVFWTRSREGEPSSRAALPASPDAHRSWEGWCLSRLPLQVPEEVVAQPKLCALL